MHVDSTSRAVHTTSMVADSHPYLFTPIHSISLLMDAHPITCEWSCVDLLRLRGLADDHLVCKLRYEPWHALTFDSERRTLLHHAARYQATIRIVALLLRLHPQATRVEDAEQRLPLHYAMMHPRPLVSAVEAMLLAYPEGCYDSFGNRPGGHDNRSST